MQLFDVEIQEGARDVWLHNASMTYMSLGFMSHVHYITHTSLALINMRRNDFIVSKIPLSLGLRKHDDVMLFVPFV